MLLLRPSTCLRCELHLLFVPAISTRHATRQARRRTFATVQTSSPEIYDVVCVGGGPAGLSLVTALKASPATSRLKIALVEGMPPRDWAPGPDKFDNRCVSLTPRTVRFLHEIGAWDHIDHSRIQPYSRMHVWDGVSDASISFLDPPPAPSAVSEPHIIATMLENNNITTALTRRLAALDSPPTVFQPAKVSAITLGPPASADPSDLDLSSWPHLAFSTGHTLAARLLIGADGANSPVRTFAGIESRGWDYGSHGVVATLQLAPGAGAGPRTAYQRFLPTGPVAVLPLPGDRATLVWSTRTELAGRLKRLPAEDFVAAVNAAVRLSVAEIDYLVGMEGGLVEEVAWREGQRERERGWMGVEARRKEEERLPARVVGVQEGSVASFPLRMRQADSYVGERVALMGDAAHVTHPLAGQGLNQGQVDSEALVRVIENAVLHGEDIGSLLTLERYNAERYAANNAMLGVVDKLHKLYSVGSGPIVGLRSLGLSIVDKVEPLKQFFMKQASGV